MTPVEDRDEAVRRRRRQEALDSLALEQEREAALLGRLQTSLRDLSAWRVDEEAFARMEREDVELLRAIRFAAREPGEDSRARLQAQVDELEAEIAEAKRRQRAYARYAEALE